VYHPDVFGVKSNGVGQNFKSEKRFESTLISKETAAIQNIPAQPKNLFILVFTAANKSGRMYRFRFEKYASSTELDGGAEY